MIIKLDNNLTLKNNIDKLTKDLQTNLSKDINRLLDTYFDDPKNMMVTLSVKPNWSVIDQSEMYTESVPVEDFFK